MTDYNKWDKFAAEITDSEDENLDMQQMSEQITQSADAYDPFKGYTLSEDAKKGVNNLFEELNKGSEFQTPTSETELKEFFKKRDKFETESFVKLKNLIDECVKNLKIAANDLTQLLLDHEALRFYDILAPKCFEYLYETYSIDITMSGPSTGMCVQHVCAFWGHDQLLTILVAVDFLDPNIQDNDNFTVLHYLVERCRRFWDPKATSTLYSTLHMLCEHGLDLKVKDHRGVTGLELLNMYLSKGAFSWDGTAEMPEEIGTFRKDLKQFELNPPPREKQYTKRSKKKTKKTQTAQVGEKAKKIQTMI